MNFRKFQSSIWKNLFSICLLILIFLFLVSSPALAAINDDRFDGNVFVLYGGNSALVPPRVTLAESLKQGKPAMLVFYVDDSSDCKQFSIVVSRIQRFYGQPLEIIPIDVDTIQFKPTYTPVEPGYYYEGVVPQTVIFDQSGKVVLNKKGQIPYEQVDDTLRQVFNLLPRSESVELKRRAVNEFNTELTE